MRLLKKLGLPHLLLLCLLFLLVGRHASLYYVEAQFAHFPDLVERLQQMDRGDLWVTGDGLLEIDLPLEGPLYYWLHAPLRLLPDPLLAVHLFTALLELSALVVWLWLGQRAGLERSLRWTSAFFLVAFKDPKYILCDNLDVVTSLLTALFVVFAAAQAARRSWPLILAGLLYGCAAQVHLAGLFVAPGLLGALLLQRQGRWRRTAAFLAGWAAVVLFSLQGMRLQGERALGDQVGAVEHSFGLQNVAIAMAQGLASPLALLGLALLVWAWRRQEPLAAGPRLALHWFVVPFLLLGVALSVVLDHTADPMDTRYALLNPARAVFSAVGLLWLLDRLNDRLARWPACRLDPLALLAGVSLVLGGAGLVELAVQGRSFARERAAQAAAPCDCSAWRRQDQLAHLAADSRDLARDPALSAGPAAPRILSPLPEGLEALLYWRRTSGWRGRGALQRAARYTLHVPLLREIDLLRLPGAHRQGAALLIPGLTPLGVSFADRRGLRTLALPPADGVARLLVVTAKGTADPARPSPVRLELRRGGEVLGPRARCGCFMDEQADTASWFLFALPRSWAAGPPLELAFQSPRGEVQEVAAGWLPWPR